MPYIANTKQDREEMLKTIGVNSISELWEKTAVPDRNIDLSSIPSARSEYEVTKHLSGLASRNANELTCFLGGGFYDHIIPEIVNDLSSRSEFYTAYTPYQPEASQGTLQAIYEYQSAICRLTDLPVSNASLYDGGTALFEAIMMSVNQTRKRKVLLAGTVSPIYRKMIKCYSKNLKIDFTETPPDTVKDNPAELEKYLDNETGCVIVQYPNFFGNISDWTEFNEKAREKRIITVCSCYPTALALLKTPGEMNFDIATGEGQCLGIPLSFGGPYLGFMATNKKLMRKMPGRICGKTVDTNGKEGFVLTLQAREQHIRRESATSNICSNEALCALRAIIYMSTLGKTGFRKTAELCATKAVYAHKLLTEIDGVESVSANNFFNEFVIKLPIDAGVFVGRMIEKGYAAGFPLGRYYKDRKNELLVSVTEKRNREEIKGLAVAMEAVLDALNR